MQDPTPLEREQRHLASLRRQQALVTIRRFQPMSVWAQLIVLIFMMLLVLTVSLVSLVPRFGNPAPALCLILATMILFVAGNAIRTQRRLNALVELVMQDLDRP